MKLLQSLCSALDECRTHTYTVSKPEKNQKTTKAEEIAEITDTATKPIEIIDANKEQESAKSSSQKDVSGEDEDKECVFHLDEKKDGDWLQAIMNNDADSVRCILEKCSR